MAEEKTFTASELKRHTGDVLNEATKRPVVITQHSKPRHVVLAYEEYVEVFKRKDPRTAGTLDTMPDAHKRELLSGLDDILKDDE